MKKALQEMRTYTVRWLCECGGEMIHTGFSLNTNPPQYPHACNTCSHQESLFGEKYPGEHQYPVGDVQIVDFE